MVNAWPNAWPAPLAVGSYQVRPKAITTHGRVFLTLRCWLHYSADVIASFEFRLYRQTFSSSRLHGDKLEFAMYVVCRELIVDGTRRSPRSRWSFRHLVTMSDRFAMPQEKAFRQRPDLMG